MQEDKVMTHEELLKQVFWQRLGKRAPRTNKACLLSEKLFNDVWKDTAADIIGKDAEITALIKDNALQATYGGWLLIGLIAVSGLNMTVDEIDEILAKSKALRELNDRLDKLDKKAETANKKIKDIHENIQDLREKYEKPPY
jgi:hypothetical protein